MKKFAVLIDADNSSHRSIELILTEIAKYGTASVKRIYGDWSVESLKNWRDILLPHAITPVQQFAYVTQKDSTDMKLVIDAMDLLYAGELDGFKSGLLCYGFGKKKNTAKSFELACDNFTYVEDLQLKQKSKSKPQTTNSVQKENNPPKQKQKLIQNKDISKVDKVLLNLFYKAIEKHSDSGNWSHLGAVGSYIKSEKPNFNVKNYGKKTLTELVKSIPTIKTKTKNKQVFISKSIPQKKEIIKPNKPIKNIMTDEAILNFIYNTIDEYANAHTGWANIRSVETGLNGNSYFNIENYGKQNFQELVKIIPTLETKTMCRERYIKKKI